MDQSTIVTRAISQQQHPARPLPKLGFIGVGWIGRHRLQAVADDGCAEIAAIADLQKEALQETSRLVPGAAALDSFEALLEQELDGIVIATPSALHAAQAIAALERGLAVFCQKPLARTAAETKSIVQAAQTYDRLLAVDYSYRHVRGVAQMRELLLSGALGQVFAAELTFHNAYGPDKPWFYDVSLSGGGCLMDLGSHLADLALWMFEFPQVETIESRLYARGRPVINLHETVEDYAQVSWTLAAGASVRATCSWRLAAGRDAVIEAIFYGTEGAVALRNVNGSFYDFLIEHYRGTSRQVLAEPPDSWGGRSIVQWARRLGRGNGFDPENVHLVDVARLIDGSYGR